MGEVANIDSSVCLIIFRGLFIGVLLTSICKRKETEQDINIKSGTNFPLNPGIIKDGNVYYDQPSTSDLYLH